MSGWFTNPHGGRQAQFAHHFEGDGTRSACGNYRKIGPYYDRPAPADAKRCKTCLRRLGSQESS